MEKKGVKKIAKVTRYGTVILGFIQAFGMTYALRASNALIDNSFMSVILISIILTAGTCFLMWVGEQITAHGIGNGISLIIFAGIVARFPDGVQTIYQYLQVGTINVFQAILFAIIAVAMIVLVIAVTQGQRRIPIQYAKRVVGRKNVWWSLNIPAVESQSSRGYPNYLCVIHIDVPSHIGTIYTSTLGTNSCKLFPMGNADTNHFVCCVDFIFYILLYSYYQ